MKKFAIHTLGCKVNQYESEAVSDLLIENGYREVDFKEKADVYIINTCTVTGMSARKSRQMIRKAKMLNKNAVLIVMGCYSQTAPEEIDKIPGVDLIIGTKYRNRIVEYLNQVEKSKNKVNTVENIMDEKEFEDLRIKGDSKRTRAYIKIQDGCTQFCTYCIIPYARGPVRSREPKKIVEEVTNLANNGFKEIILTGIHVASYGKDLMNASLMDILESINKIEGIERIRLSSLEPRLVTQKFVKAIKNLDKICPHFHLSLQSGCDDTLKRMNRKYTTQEYKAIVCNLRNNITDVSITTDIMVGFPGETDLEFDATYKYVKEISFSKMHVFKYSPRKGTPAYFFPNQVSGKVKEIRSTKLLQLSQYFALEFHRKFVGKSLPVLFEEEKTASECLGYTKYLEGLTPNYIRVFCEGNTNLLGEIRNVQITKAKTDCLIGSIE